jgi:hypothetical protein
MRLHHIRSSGTEVPVHVEKQYSVPQTQSLAQAVDVKRMYVGFL